MAGADRVLIERELDFACERNNLALGGRVLDSRTPAATYPDVFLSFNGRHQGDNAAVALCAVEAFFDAAIDGRLVSSRWATYACPDVSKCSDTNRS